MATNLSQSIFRAYDIRGIVGETLTDEVVYAIGQALGSMVLSIGERQLLTARDGRLSSPTFSQHLVQGILASGCDVIDLGIVPSPLLYYATHVIHDVYSGVMLTGSHNPANYNGLKIILNRKPLTEIEIKNIYQKIINNDLLNGAGSYRSQAIIDSYLAHICSSMKLSRKLKIVVDAGNGVTGAIAPLLYEKLGCEVHQLFCEIDGTFPNHHPDPSDTANLQDLIAAVTHLNADVGLAFDGDGDRLGVVTNRGEIILSDRLLMLYAHAILEKHPASKIIFDVKCTNNLAMLIQKLGGEPIMWKTGHSLIRAKLFETNAVLAGEMSGHFFFNDGWFGFDDGLYAGARLLEILAQNTQDCSSLFANIPNSINTPELKVSVTDEEKFNLMQQLIDKANFDSAKEIQTIDGLRVDFTNGWGLLRPSNTSPYLILRFEAINEVILKNIQTMFKELMLSVNPDLVLPF